MKSKVVFIFSILTLFWVVDLLAEGLPERPLTKITIAEYDEFLLYAPLYVGVSKGYFKEEGLDVTIVPAGGDEKVFAALLSGSAHLGVSDPLFVAIAGEKGQAGRVVSAVLQGVPAWGLTKDPKIAAIKSPVDLKNYSVATYPAPSTNYTLQKRMFKAGGLEPNIKQIAYGASLAALAAGEVDIILEFEPVASAAELQGAHRVFAMSDYYPDFAITGLTALPQYIDNNPTEVQGAVNALQRGFNFIHASQNEAELISILAARFKNISTATIKVALKYANQVNTFPKHGIVPKRGWDSAVKTRLEVGDLKNITAYEDYVITSFAEKAKSINQ